MLNPIQRGIVALAVVGASLGLYLGHAQAVPVFTGNAETDMDPALNPAVVVVADPGGVDVGLPYPIDPSVVSGWDIKDLRTYHDQAADTLYVAVNTYGIAGDADGDGNPGAAGNLAAAGISGSDPANLGGSETAAVVIDIDEDGIGDAVAGVSAFTNIGGFAIKAFTGNNFNPGLAFGASLTGVQAQVFGSPSAAAPDLEFTITGLSNIPASSGQDNSPSFAASAFMGAVEDGGIGEDHSPVTYFSAAEFPMGPGTGVAPINWWRDHPEAWAWWVDSMVVGGKSYSRDQLLALLRSDKLPDGSRANDKSLALFRAEVGARINRIAGNLSSCIDDSIAQADGWLISFPLNGPKVPKQAWKLGDKLRQRLNDYNDGKLCAPRDPATR